MSNVILVVKRGPFSLGHFTKMCSAKFLPIILKASPKLLVTKYNGCNLQIETYMEFNVGTLAYIFGSQ